MTFNDLMIVLSKLGVDTGAVSDSRPNQVLIPCVLAKWMHKSGSDSHPSLSIRYGDPGKWTVFKCFACKEQGRLWELVDTYGHLAEDDSIKTLATQLADTDEPSITSLYKSLTSGMRDWFQPKDSQKQLKVLNDTALARYNLAGENPKAKQYLLDRGVSPGDSSIFDIRYDAHQDRVVFPVRQQSGELVGAVGRFLKEGEPRYWNYLGFSAGNTLGGIHMVRPESSVVMVVEGFFDLLRAYGPAQSLNADVVCTWRAEMTTTQAGLLAGLDKNIQIWYDQDSAGKAGWETAKKQLAGTTYGLQRATWDNMNLDVGEMPPSQIMSIFKTLQKGVLG